VNGDGKPEVLAASQTGYVYALDARGKAVWRRRVGADVAECLILPGKRILALDRGGDAVILDFGGIERARFNLDMTPTRAVLRGDRIIVGGPGRIAAYRF